MGWGGGLMSLILKSSGIAKGLSVSMLALLTACTSLPNAKQTTNTGLMSIPAKQTGVYIISYDKDKKDILMQAIGHHADEILYEYKNLGSMLAIKISAEDLVERINDYKQIDGVIQIAKSQTMHLQ